MLSKLMIFQPIDSMMQNAIHLEDFSVVLNALQNVRVHSICQMHPFTATTVNMVWESGDQMFSSRMASHGIQKPINFIILTHVRTNSSNTITTVKRATYVSHTATGLITFLCFKLFNVDYYHSNSKRTNDIFAQRKRSSTGLCVWWHDQWSRWQSLHSHFQWTQSHEN